MDLDPQSILQLLARLRRPVTGREIANRLDLSSRQSRQLYRLLEVMARHGDVRHQRGGRFSLAKGRRAVQGRLQVLRNGAGIVVPEHGGRELYIPEFALGGALPGDLVEVLPLQGARGKRPQGDVVRIIESDRSFVGVYRAGRKGGIVAPVDDTLPAPVPVSEPLPEGLRTGQVVVVRSEVQAGGSSRPTIVKVLGDADDSAIEVLAIAHRFGLATEFSAAARSAAKDVLQQVSPDECVQRVDLRALPFVTIDGETAKDFDDAVALQVDANGNRRLWVAIADVAHYVSEGGGLDIDAQLRGTSVYFPGTCLPMLPEALSNGICSLNPRVDRLVLVAEMLFSSAGERLEQAFHQGVICSQARLTYTEVQQFLDTDEVTGESPHLAQLRPMARLASVLTERRRQRGSLDLDLPETEIVLDAGGEAITIRKAVRLAAHRLIEEFMLAANETVAGALAAAGFPVVYRIHEPPQDDALQTCFTYARHLGATPPGRDIDLVHGLQRMLESVPDEATRHLLHRSLLRSLTQARYDTTNRGHFGLAAEDYCHFTSPIRRYPDLVVHRLLKSFIAGEPPERFGRNERRRLSAVAESSSQAERKAVDAERDMKALKCCQVMQKHVGEVFSGHVASVHPFGFFVELDDIFVEGLVHVASLGDDYYHFDQDRYRLTGERNRRQFSPGTVVRVRVVRANPIRREIDLELAADVRPEQAPRRPHRKLTRY